MRVTLFVMNFCVIILHQLLSVLGALPWWRVIGDKCLVWKSRDRIHYSPGNPAAVLDYCDSESVRGRRMYAARHAICYLYSIRTLFKTLHCVSTHFSIPIKPLTFSTCFFFFFWRKKKKKEGKKQVCFICQIDFPQEVLTMWLTRFLVS